MLFRYDFCEILGPWTRVVCIGLYRTCEHRFTVARFGVASADRGWHPAFPWRCLEGCRPPSCLESATTRRLSSELSDRSMDSFNGLKAFRHFTAVSQWHCIRIGCSRQRKKRNFNEKRRSGETDRRTDGRTNIMHCLHWVAHYRSSVRPQFRHAISSIHSFILLIAAASNSVSFSSPVSFSALAPIRCTSFHFTRR